jgi:hypothetical protein
MLIKDATGRVIQDTRAERITEDERFINSLSEAPVGTRSSGGPHATGADVSRYSCESRTENAASLPITLS